MRRDTRDRGSSRWRSNLTIDHARRAAPEAEHSPADEIRTARCRRWAHETTRVVDTPRMDRRGSVTVYARQGPTDAGVDACAELDASTLATDLALFFV